ncbi:MAG: (2Fe-2S)-binding protein [Armatimonadetes bacterium]|nr:(2Fe-2S)-binding protein [Armatimonadota bacterium]
MEISFILNGNPVNAGIAPTQTLLDVLRESFRLTGTKEGCSEGECGACTVLVNGKAVVSCLMLAPQAEGCEVTTIEGLSLGGELHPIQTAFVKEGAVQCGYCTPGAVMSSYALLSENPRPGEGEIRAAIAGNLCRCTGYQKIVKAVQRAAEEMDDPV